MIKNKWIVLSVTVILFGGTLTKVLLFPSNVADKAVNSVNKVVDKTLDANNILQNYEFFKQQYEDYLALKSTIEMSNKELEDFKSQLPKERDKWDNADKNEFARLQTNLSGQKQQLNNIISEYNAKSKMQNRNLFKSKDLPDSLDMVN